MRRLAFSGLVLLAATSCSPSLKGASQPLAQEQVGAGLGLDVASARRTALDFVNAYAHTTEDDGGRLSALVVGPKLTTWVKGVKFMEYQDTEKRLGDKGGIALQVHGGGDYTKQFVRYRNIRVKELGK